MVGICCGTPKIDQQDQQEADQLRSQIQNCFQRLLLARIVNHLLQCQLQSPARQDHQHADRRDQSQRLQYQVNHDLSLYLDLLSPSPVERHKLLLRSQAIVEDALDILLSADLLQPVDSFGTRFCRRLYRRGQRLLPSCRA